MASGKIPKAQKLSLYFSLSHLNSAQVFLSEKKTNDLNAPAST
jgi:hypothetical protein